MDDSVEPNDNLPETDLSNLDPSGEDLYAEDSASLLQDTEPTSQPTNSQRLLQRLPERFQGSGILLLIIPLILLLALCCVALPMGLRGMLPFGKTVDTGTVVPGAEATAAVGVGQDLTATEAVLIPEVPVSAVTPEPLPEQGGATGTDQSGQPADTQTEQAAGGGQPGTEDVGGGQQDTGAAPASTGTGGAGLQYRVRWGDTLWGISRRYCGTGWVYVQQIYKANKHILVSPQLIFPGQNILIPCAH